MAVTSAAPAIHNARRHRENLAPMTVAADKDTRPGWGWAGRALQWWLGELAGLSDDAARRLRIGSRNAITLEAGERYWLLRRGQRPLGQIDRAAPEPETSAALARLVAAGHGRAPLTVEIPHERILTKRITLPAMAQRELGRILHFEIARHFPFPAERVHFRHRVIGSGGADRGTIEVEIAAVARAAVDEICQALAEAGLRPSRVCLAGGRGAPPLFLALAGLRRSTAMLTRLERALVLSLAALAILAAASPVVSDRVHIAAAERQLAALRPQAQAMLDQRERQRRAAAALAGPLRLAAARPPLVAVLDALTKAVPDGAWLQSLSLTGREIVVDGLSPSAAAVALALENGHAFANLVFRAPITRDPQTGLEHFQLGAAIAEPKP
jgi:general secretion pathway protein L